MVPPRFLAAGPQGRSPVRESAGAAGKGEPKLLNPSEVIASLRDLIVHLHRGNVAQAESILTDVAAYLKQVMQSGADPGSLDMKRTQQTLFAIDEVRTLFTEGDFEGAAIAARDAAKEWRQMPAHKTSGD
jgi:hypothetical protein